MARLIINTGDKFNRLTIVKEVEKRYGHHRYFECLCDCGKTHIERLYHLKKGTVKSCGCYNKESHTKHGHRPNENTSTLTYNSWKAMKQRCRDINSPNYKIYGGAGITVCERWINSFENFLEDMGERPLGTTLDRFPNQRGNYEPGNCRWATPKEQANNRRQRGYKTN